MSNMDSVSSSAAHGKSSCSANPCQSKRHVGKLPIHGDASAKATLYKDRFLLLFQRPSRDPRFSKPAFGSTVSEYGSCEISPIQSLVGQTGRRWVMGVISQLEDGHFYLEDLSAAVEVNLSDSKITTGFFVENTVVLAEGEMQLDGVFKEDMAREGFTNSC